MRPSDTQKRRDAPHHGRRDRPAHHHRYRACGPCAVPRLDFSRSRYGQSSRSMSRRVEDRHLLKVIEAFVSRRSPDSGKSPCYTTTLNSAFAIATFFRLKEDTRERELLSRIRHAQSTFRRVPINFRRTERVGPALPQFVGEPCNFFARVFSLPFFLLVGCQARVIGAAYQLSNLPTSQ